MRAQGDLLISILGPARVGIAKLKGGKEEVQEAVHLALPSVPIEEDADPGNHTLKQKYGKGPEACQGDCFHIWDASPVLLGATASRKSLQVNQLMAIVVPHHRACTGKDHMPFNIWQPVQYEGLCMACGWHVKACAWRVEERGSALQQSVAIFACCPAMFLQHWPLSHRPWHFVTEVKDRC